MKKILLTYGLIAGFVIIGSMTLTLILTGGTSDSMQFTEYLGYLFMIAALSLIFVGTKRYRDQELGGVIKFGTAFKLGLGITLVASIVYVISWEINLAVTGDAFIEDYTQSIIDSREADGASPAEMEGVIAEMESMKASYSNPIYRLPMTFAEIFPVGLLIALLSAALLRKSEFMPAA